MGGVEGENIGGSERDWVGWRERGGGGEMVTDTIDTLYRKCRGLDECIEDGHRNNLESWCVGDIGRKIEKRES